ncbi:response regulator transcription factor [Vallitalea sp.]|jgi:two-component system response regulator YesN|uniref:response regulator transcription factor n=1 Tax=Vallitalea sp. TaxID=1882829 RepID=UPI0025EBDDF2|nr:response regulator [Vallitalea sp.]MCT4686451.1 response regulator [Vallitalea sp.]
MYKVFIVDDEIWIRTGLEKTIEWESMNLSILGSVNNAEEAINAMNNNYPDILITDIVMNNKNGIDLTKWIKEHNPNTQVIIISGFDKFEYAKAAIKLGVTEYILKPIDENILIKALYKCIDNLNKNHTYTILKESSNINNMKENFYLRMFCNTNNDFDNKTLQDQITHIDLNVDYHYISTMFAASYNKNTISPDILKHKMNAFISKYKKNNHNLDIIVRNQEEIIVVFATKNTDIPYFKKYALRLSSLLMEQINELHIGDTICYVGNCYKGIKGIYSSFHEIQTLKSETIICNNKHNIIDIDNLKTASKPTILIDSDIKSQIVDALKNNSWDNIFMNIDILFDEMNRLYIINRNDLISYIYNIVYECNEIIISSNTELNIPFNKDSELLGWIFQTTNLTTTKENMKDYFNYLKNNMDISDNNVHRKIIREIISYCNNNFDKTINLVDLAEHFHISSSYLSQLFSKEVGTPLSKYLTNLRIEKAKEILKTSNLRVYEIAEMVGYCDVKYFLKVFKKNVGVSPQVFREKY